MCKSEVARFLSVGSLSVVLSSLLLGPLALPGRDAWAIPSFARQTGLRCNVCHTAFPELTPFGREFKLNGYVKDSHAFSWFGHFSGMLVPTFTHTSASQPEGAGEFFGPNDNLALQETSVFYGGRLLDSLGMFAQITYSGVEHNLGWDNLDIRYAHSASMAERPVTYGITVNNNPSVQDLWNTTPVWSFPFVSSDLAPTPAASTLIDGGLAQQVAGLGGYALFDHRVYAELDGYRTLSNGTQRAFGVNTSEENWIDGTAPYWRVALPYNWGKHSLEVGTFGLDAHTFLGRDELGGTNHFTDVAVDAQYQYLGNVDGLTFQSSWIHEQQGWDAGQPLGETSNAEDTLRTFKARFAYLYDKTYRFNLGYFNINGNTDPLLYADSRTGSPNSNGWIIQLDYMPLHKNGGPSFWPWLNVQLTLQYVIYSEFDGAAHNYDGAGRNASDNNTLFLSAWMAF